MLGDEATGRGEASIVDQLKQVMSVNHLNPEQMLARFFDAAVLGTYCSTRLGKSDKGSAATLAGRIAREWARPDFGGDDGADDEPSAPTSSAAPKAAWSAPSWLELQSDSDDDEEEAERKRTLKRELKAQKANADKAKVEKGAPSGSAAAEEDKGVADKAAVSGPMAAELDGVTDNAAADTLEDDDAVGSEPKRRKLTDEEIAGAMTHGCGGY